jgi:putative DNA primase/helicase
VPSWKTRGASANSKKRKRNATARKLANSVFENAALCDFHPYTARKGIQPHGARVQGDRLVIPLRDVDGTIHSLQFIGADGEKRFLTGGRKAGCYFDIGQPDGVLCVAEGFATGASIHEATGLRGSGGL